MEEDRRTLMNKEGLERVVYRTLRRCGRTRSRQGGEEREEEGEGI